MTARANGTLPAAVWWTTAGLGSLAMGYATITAAAWCRYGHVRPAAADEEDPLLDQFMPHYEVAERHHVHVAAPAPVALSAAAETDLYQAGIIRAIFKTREILIGAHSGIETRPQGLLAQMTSLGWRVLAERPGREIVVGAVTQPWLPDVVFRGLAPADFCAFHEPGYVKIAWTLRADPAGGHAAIFRTETRVTTTDPVARRMFRWYWARFSPGIVVIRRLLLREVAREAETRARADRAGRRAGHSLNVERVRRWEVARRRV